ncbi:MAG: hypothetical protein NVS3B21_13460 [Acidimicrobiales bacterium]
MSVRPVIVNVAARSLRRPHRSLDFELERVRRVSQAAHRLAAERPGEPSHELETLLSRVEETLATIGGDDGLEPRVTATLRAVRDQLTSHLMAAASLEAIEVPRATVVDVLRRATVAIEEGLDSVDGMH